MEKLFSLLFKDLRDVFYNNHAKNCNCGVVNHSNRSEKAKGNFYNNSVEIMIIMRHNKTYRTRYRDVLN